MTIPNKTPPAKFARLWNDASLRTSEVAYACGFVSGAKAARRRAAALGLPPRPAEGPGRRAAVDCEATFRALWRAGEPVRLMARRWGCTDQAIRNAAIRFGLGPRGQA